MKLVITYDVNVDALEENYRKYLAERKDMLEYYDRIGMKKVYEKNMPWMNFEQYVKKFYLEDYSIENLEDDDYIYNRKIKLKTERKEA